MITQEDVSYSEETIENLTAAQIRDIYEDSVLLWMCGSGSGVGHPAGSYSYVMDYRGRTKYSEGEIYGASTNAAMIEGFLQAVSGLKKPVSILVLTPCPLGFQTGFRGKGPNAGEIQAALEIVKKKGCTLKTGVITGDLIKRFVMEQSGRVMEPKENHYKKVIYRECLDKVCQVLQQNGTAPEIIAQIREISPDSV